MLLCQIVFCRKHSLVGTMCMITLDCINCKEIVRNLKDKRIKNIHTSSIKSYTHKWNTHINILIIYLLYIYVCIQNISKQNNKYLKSCTLFACATLPPPTLSSYNSLPIPLLPMKMYILLEDFANREANKTNNWRWLNKSILIFAKSSQN